MAEPRFPPPDLSDGDALRAYRRELRGIARWTGLAGFVLCVAGVAAYFSPIVVGWWWLWGVGAVDVALAIEVVGWLLLVVTFFRRNIHHRRRLRGEIPGPA
jgi:hypothetical protein